MKTGHPAQPALPAEERAGDLTGASAFVPQLTDLLAQALQEDELGSERLLAGRHDPAMTAQDGLELEREDPALTGIEYHCSLYRFFRKNRGRGRMAIVFVLRIAKSLFCMVNRAPQAEARR